MRPKIVCHMMSSIDGLLLSDRWTPPASGIERSALFRHYDAVGTRFAADGWIVGRKTTRAYAKGLSPATGIAKVFERRPHVATGGTTIFTTVPISRRRRGKHSGGSRRLGVESPVDARPDPESIPVPQFIVL